MIKEVVKKGSMTGKIRGLTNQQKKRWIWWESNPLNAQLFRLE